MNFVEAKIGISKVGKSIKKNNRLIDENDLNNLSKEIFFNDNPYICFIYQVFKSINDLYWPNGIDQMVWSLLD